MAGCEPVIAANVCAPMNSRALSLIATQNISTGFDEASRQVGRFVSGDSARHTKKDAPVVEHYSSTASVISVVSTATLPSAISSIAMVSGFRERE